MPSCRPRFWRVLDGTALASAYTEKPASRVWHADGGLATWGVCSRGGAVALRDGPRSGCFYCEPWARCLASGWRLDLLGCLVHSEHRGMGSVTPAWACVRVCLFAGEAGFLLCSGPRLGGPARSSARGLPADSHALSPPRPRLEQPYLSANTQFFQALSQCPALQRLCLVSRSGTLQPEAVLAFMARCLHVVVCHMFTGESLATCKSLQQALLRR